MYVLLNSTRYLNTQVWFYADMQYEILIGMFFLPFRKQMSEGATYFGLSSFSPALQRCRSHLYPTTIAESGASIEGEMAFSAGVIAALEKGSTAYVKRFDETGHMYDDKV